MKSRAAKGICILLIMSMMSTLNISRAFAEEVKENATIYVDTAGNDATGDGTQNKPYASVDKARLEARKLKQENKIVTVQVNAGKYFISEPINFTPEDSGVTYNGTGAILSGAKNLEPANWTTYSGNIKVADVPANLGVDQLFVNGEQQILARYPNYNADQVLQGSTTQADIKNRSAGWADPAGGYIRALHSNKWGGNSYRITGKNASALGLSYTWIGDNNRGSGYNTSNIMVENILKELDSPKEWYYDGVNGKLYYYPPDGVDVNSALMEGAVTEDILQIQGVEDGDQVTDLTFNGFTIENTKRTMFTSTYVPLMRSDWCVARKGAVFMENAENVTFQNGTIRNIGGNAVFLSGHCKGITIFNNDIMNIGSSGVLVAGLPDSCREPSFWADTPTPEVTPYYVHKTAINDTQPGPIKEHYPRESTIANNHIKNIGIWEKQSSHVGISVAYKISVLRNTMNVGPRAGINVGDGTFGGHEIAYNDIFDVQKETDDHGMFNSWGRDRYWSLGGFDTGGNRGAQKEPYSLLDVIDPIEIHDNRMHFESRLDGGNTFGIDLDDGSSNYKIYNNLCLNMGIKLREGFHREVYNNIIVNGQFNLHCTFEDSTDRIEKNIIIKGTPYALAATNEARFSVSKDVIDNNWNYDFGMKSQYPSFWSNLTYDAHTINGNPEFKNPQTNDYTVQNTKLADLIGFVNFPMDQFGKPGCSEQSPVYVKTTPDGNEDILEEGEWLGATVSALDDAIMSSTGAGGLDGVYVKDAPENSQAARNGLQQNDVIKSINGTIIGQKSNFEGLYNAVQDNAVVSLGIIRNQLPETLNFVKADPIVSEVVLDDRDSSITYSGASWMQMDSGHGGIKNTLSAKNVATSTSQGEKEIYCEVPFHGQQISFYTRIENNMGDYAFTVTDQNGKTVQTATKSALNDTLKDGVELFKSDIFPEGDYKLRVQRITGDYAVVDAFAIRSYAASTAPPVVTGPAAITADDVRVTELTSDKKIKIDLPVRNNGTAALRVTADVVLRGGDGVISQESLQSDTKAIDPNQVDTFHFNVSTPLGSESKKLEILIYGTDSAKPFAYPYVIEGKEIVPKVIPVNNAVNDNILYSYQADNGIVTLSAKGFPAQQQVLVSVTDKDQKAIACFQITADQNGNAKGAFAISSEYRGILTAGMSCENGLKKTTDINIQGQEIRDDTQLKEEISASVHIIETGRDIYTSETWFPFYDAYYAALSNRDTISATQDTVNEAAQLLKDARTNLKERMTKTEVVPSLLNPNDYQIYRPDGTQDGGNRDALKGDVWQVRNNQIDATAEGAYVEFKGEYASFELQGANKYDSADFRVQIVDDESGSVVADDTITMTRTDGTATVPVYTKTGLSGKAQTVRIYHNDDSSATHYLEIRKIVYATMNGTGVSAITGIAVSKLPAVTQYDFGYQGNVVLAGGEITETYADGTSKIIPMNNDMYQSGFSTDSAGEKKITIKHAGFEAEIAVQVSEPVRYDVSVLNGSGDGQYEAGSTVQITADPAPAGKLFDRWLTGDGVTFADAGASTTSFIMPAKAVSITALYKDKPLERIQIVSVSISNMQPMVGDVLSAQVNPAGASVLYSWKVGDVERASGPEYEVLTDDVGKTITVTVTGTGTYDGTKTSTATAEVKDVPVPKVLVQSIIINGSKPLTVGMDTHTQLMNAVFPENADDKSLTWSSSDSSIAAVSDTGILTAGKRGTAVITARANDGSNVSATCEVTVGYKISVKLDGGINNAKNTSGFVGNKTVYLSTPVKKGYLFKGWYTDKKLTKQITKIKKGTKGNLTLYAKWEKITVGKVSINTLSNSAKETMKVSYDKVSGAKGYEIRYATNSKFTHNLKSITTKYSSKSIKNLTRKSSYYVKVRAYKTDPSGNKIYGKFSSARKVYIKK